MDFTPPNDGGLAATEATLGMATLGMATLGTATLGMATPGTATAGMAGAGGAPATAETVAIGWPGAGAGAECWRSEWSFSIFMASACAGAGGSGGGCSIVTLFDANSGAAMSVGDSVAPSIASSLLMAGFVGGCVTVGLLAFANAGALTGAAGLAVAGLGDAFAGAGFGAAARGRAGLAAGLALAATLADAGFFAAAGGVERPLAFAGGFAALGATLAGGRDTDLAEAFRDFALAAERLRADDAADAFMANLMPSPRDTGVHACPTRALGRRANSADAVSPGAMAARPRRRVARNWVCRHVATSRKVTRNDKFPRQAEAP